MRGDGLDIDSSDGMIRETRLVGLSPEHAIALRDLGWTLMRFATDAGTYEVRDRSRAECRAVAKELRHLEGYLGGMAIYLLSDMADRAEYTDVRKTRLVQLAKRRADELGHMAEAFEQEVAENLIREEERPPLDGTLPGSPPRPGYFIDG